MNVKKLPYQLIFGFLGLFLLSAGVSMAAFTFLTKDSSLTSTGKKTGGKVSRVDLTKPKTESCPINGAMFTKAEKDIWSKKRPMLAIIENHLDSRPQSGLSRADVVYEIIAEGGITRFLSVFYCGIADNDYIIGQIRSARVYFINYALEYGDKPLFVHWGGANNICNNCPGGIKPRGDIDPRVDAYKYLEKNSWVNGRYGNDMNGATNTGYPALFTDDRRMDLATEHQKVGSTDKIYEEATKRGFEYQDSEGNAWDTKFKSWKFIDDKAIDTPTHLSIKFNFWDSMAGYDVEWKYDKAKNIYFRFNGGLEHKDLESGEQLTAKNIAIVYVKEEGPVDNEHHMLYTVTGKGKATMFQNGNAIEGTWEKMTATDRLKFVDEKGSEIPLVRGQIWIEVLPAGNDISY
ncbi:hypothetical protein A2130_01435 [Candidatus Woesebacteria bacterium GWC2_33_12]|uniref:PT repeat-containing protein n=1 Tax=Candidatus Woesebacteria bacterium GW2011_GWB1_33_22 TaxID=1618566 RepID=A0A0F9ZL91_9BACT|nr:MAG: hypothetical protein UR29_C0007G0004 [Candidatus Woesebacteria bacterium GW2011_GWC2_33_12]KKP42140.1 MAG: hypothetical protein UR33_C0005G0004 [Candidatus Woesebacteria bacterium GW2011_GWA2_33_20]KKP44874.1 MAG: hypothetical protein UR35_C0005G0004 [Candidatus Woesebacteria bacterium GW2011_GWB1_33_22]KKP46688.1 MAG: hypothetical protein UR37_C0005G0004 [Microgenomates group bacterium GW2011_GWC1_33_28]KKP50588.1 MAG: hypothetical protein UR41_C0005G0004 [Candidatus Woesebacteria bact